MMMIEPSPLPFGERGLRLGNLRNASPLPFLVDGRSDAGVSGGRELGELGTSMDVTEGLLRPENTESLGGSGGGLESELNLKPLKRESNVDIVVVVAVQPSFDPTCLIQLMATKDTAPSKYTTTVHSEHSNLAILSVYIVPISTLLVQSHQ